MTQPVRPDREVMPYDVAVVGAGPAGLACAIALKRAKPDATVCILEKGASVGAHLLAGAVLEPRALDELIPDWKDKGAPLTVPVAEDRFLFLTPRRAFRLPFLPAPLHNTGNYVIALGAFAAWLAEQAQEAGVDIFPGFAAAEVLYGVDGGVIGIATGDMGRDRDGAETARYVPGVEIHARQTVFAEGCRGSLTKTVTARFGLDADADPQTYGIGIKEVWDVPADRHRPGLVVHTVGWPLDGATYGGGWLYHAADGRVSVGFVTGLDYANPFLSPFDEMQRFKMHPAIRAHLDGGTRVAYGARALVEGGFQSLPALVFPGGLLAGDTAGFLNVPKIKGIHTAMKSGMLAGEALAAHLDAGDSGPCAAYPEALRASWLWDELYRARNVRPGFHAGLAGGLLQAGFQMAGGWRLPYTLRNRADYAQLKKAKDCKKIDYPKPDGILTFDRASSVYLSNIAHEDNQPVHLKLRDPSIPVNENLPDYEEPAQRYCPAGVYEIVRMAAPDGAGVPEFRINAQNCVHCKTCDIKDPAQNINWTVPEGGSGPHYTDM